MSDGGTETLVYALEDMVWDKTDLGAEFWISKPMVDSNYTSCFTAQVTKFGPGGQSPLHHHTYNHAFYFLSGTSKVQIDDETWDIKPGTFVKVPAYKEHSVANSGTDDLIFLVIYDPPHVDGTP